MEAVLYRVQAMDAARAMDAEQSRARDEQVSDARQKALDLLQESKAR